ncbi:Uncharacterised protein [Salmonella enterica subsp. enterica]|uniref:Uncharacterized protein n=1 Tax=Salmonella enterica I TaxID=59201 RepID=A0A379WJU0_SALET|nr:Uncharacterised protein [Salmonella enterica subsp. enterica]
MRTAASQETRAGVPWLLLTPVEITTSPGVPVGLTRALICVCSPPVAGQCARREAAAGKGLVDMGRVSMGRQSSPLCSTAPVACAQTH